ncbi:glycoside hydrolase family 5 protein [Maribacter sp. 2210JD10-5]|uniref:glycoside hydrolase family 5 protein n=1 Tax=Maribacter sp. 2210JD10-5 TaxID=3386272 RepID=UPI0039BD62B9
MRTAIFQFLIVLSCSISISCQSSAAEEMDNEDTVTNEKDNPTTDDENEEETTSGTVVSLHGQLHVDGNRILDKNDEEVQLRGMSFFWSQWIEGSKYYTPETVAWLKKDWQCTVVRAAMGIEDDGGYITDPEVNKQRVFTVIDAAIEQGIYVIVDWHSHHAEDYLEQSKAFFAEVAQKYGNTPNIIYEIYNEPLDTPAWNTVLKPYHEAVIKEIRKFDADNIIICGTRTWSQRVDEVIGNEINDENVAYTLHYYASSHKQELRNIAKQALDNDIALFVTEYGTTEFTGNGTIDIAETNTWWDFLDENKISWCNWSVADKVESASALKPNSSTTGDWTMEDLTQSGAMVRDEIKAQNQKFE